LSYTSVGSSGNYSELYYVRNIFKFRLGHILASEFRGSSQPYQTNVGNMTQPLLSDDIRERTAADLLETHSAADDSITQYLSKLRS
jgi:hypothetical protein